MMSVGELTHKNFDRIIDDPNLRCSAGIPMRAWEAHRVRLQKSARRG